MRTRQLICFLITSNDLCQGSITKLVKHSRQLPTCLCQHFTSPKHFSWFWIWIGNLERTLEYVMAAKVRATARLLLTFLTQSVRLKHQASKWVQSSLRGHMWGQCCKSLEVHSSDNKIYSTNHSSLPCVVQSIIVFNCLHSAVVQWCHPSF